MLSTDPEYLCCVTVCCVVALLGGILICFMDLQLAAEMLILFSQIQYPFYNSTNMVGGVYKGVSFILLSRDNCDGSELQVAQNSFVWAGDTKLVELYLYRQWGTTVQKKCLRTQSYGPSAGVECRKCAVRHVCKTPTWSISS